MTSSLRSRLARVAAGTVLLVGALGAVAYASDQLTSSSDGGSEPTFPHQPTRTAASGVDASLAAAFSVLRRDRAQADAFPNPENSDVAQLGAAYGPNLALAREGRNVDGMRFFVIPGNDSVCLEAVGPDPLSGVGGGCVRTAQALDGYMVRVALTRGGIRVMGLLPDGATDVRVVLASGTQVDVPLVDNVYTTEMTESLASVEFTLDGERRDLPTPFEMAHLAQEQNGRPVRIR